MSSKTQNYNLERPGYEDKADIAVINSNMNLIDAALAAKLDAANKYVHPTTPGNKHIPAGGQEGQILKYYGDGEAQWGDSTGGSPIYVYTITAEQAEWTGSVAPYTQVIEVIGIRKDDAATVDIDLAGAADFAEEQSLLAEWAKVYRVRATDDDEVTLWASDEVGADLEINIMAVRA
jgi:hypothetical protein